MSKPLKKVDFSKTLIRNAEASVPRTVVNLESTSSGYNSVKAQSVDSKPECIVREKFDTPELYSTLQLSRKLDSVVKPRKTKSVSDIDKNKLAADEKVTRKVNFPFDQPIYKDLISLTCDREQTQPLLVSRGPILLKDKEPNLADFITPKTIEEYHFQPILTRKETKVLPVNQNNLRLYKILQIHNERIDLN